MAKKDSFPKLLRDFVLIERDDALSVTHGGILIPETARDKATRGTVVAVGPGRYIDAIGKVKPMAVKVGDVVAFPRFTNDMDELNVNGVKYLLTNEQNIIGIL